MLINTITIQIPLPCDKEAGEISNEDFDRMHPHRVLIDGKDAVYPLKRDEKGMPTGEENPEFMALSRGNGGPWDVNEQALHSLAYVAEMGALKAMQKYLSSMRQLEMLRSIFGDKLPMSIEDIVKGNVDIQVMELRPEDMMDRLKDIMDRAKGTGDKQDETFTPATPSKDDEGDYGKLV